MPGPPSLRRLAFLALAAVVMSCGGASGTPAGGERPLVIGAIYPLTGPQASGGKDELSGVEAALSIARSRGMLGGKQIELKVIDATTPQAARAAVDQLIDRFHVPAVIGTYGSTLSAAASAEADRRHTVYWETGAVADQITEGKRWVFRTVATGGTLGTTAVRFTERVLLPRDHLAPSAARAVIVNVDDIYGRSVSDAELAQARAAGVNVVSRIEYSPYRYDPSSIAAQVKAARPDYLWDVSYVPDAVAIWRQVLAHHVALKAAVGTSSAFCQPEFGRELGAEAVGLFAADKPAGDISPGALDPAARALLDRAQGLYASSHGGQEMTIPAVAGFVGGWTLFTDVMPRVTTPVTAAAIRAVALTVDVPEGDAINGGGVRFAQPGASDAGQNLRAASIVGQWQAPEVMRVVYPAGFVTRATITMSGSSW